ncbi:MAG: HAD-IA family hydrolase [Spirochaetia bacterium]|nr:HAD-IA family hydrolase [Spirochaetia bacterium]
MKNIKLFIFDWDGTLIDSIALIAECLIVSFQELGFGDLSDEKARSIIGLGLVDALAILTPGRSGDDRQKLLQTYKKHFHAMHANSIQLYPGVFGAILELHERKIKLAIATGKSRQGLERDLHFTNLKPFFHATRTIDECKPKPDPHMITDILSELQLSPEEAIMIGDTTFDLEMAAKAGVKSIASLYGAHSMSDLKRFKPLEYFEDFLSLSRFILKQE